MEERGRRKVEVNIQKVCREREKIIEKGIIHIVSVLGNIIF